jgi:DNA polymerase-3 subunit gamma/tau
MAEIVLYRKYRSMNFDEVVGQQHVVRSLRNAILADEVGHAFLFAGSRGIGKTSMARILARAVNCRNLTKEGNPCNECDICQSFINQSSMDLIEVDAASHRGIDDVRFLQEGASFAPNIAKTKVFIIDEVHMLTKEAFNALLKTLEEPPKHSMFILATTEIHKVPETILSRCQTHYFDRISTDDIAKHLILVAQKEGITLDDKKALVIANSVKGGMRDALGILEQLLICSDKIIQDEDLVKLLGIVEESILKNIFDFLLAGQLSDLIKYFHNEVYTRGVDVDRLMSSLESYFRNLMLIDVSKVGTDHGNQWTILFEELKRARGENFEIDALNFELFAIRTINRLHEKNLIHDASNDSKPNIMEQNKIESKHEIVNKPVEEEKVIVEKEVPDNKMNNSVGADKLIAEWNNFLNTISAQNPLLASILKMSEVKSEGGKIEIIVNYALQKRQLETNGNLDLFNKIASQFVGGNVVAIVNVGQKKDNLAQKRNLIDEQMQQKIGEQTGDKLKKEVEEIFEGEEV